MVFNIDMHPNMAVGGLSITMQAGDVTLNMC